jgi:hypothetical protein
MFSKENKTNLAYELTIDITESTGFALLGMMKTSSPVDGDIAFATVKAGGTFHATSSTDTAEFEQSIEDRAIVSDVVFALLLHVGLHVVRGDLLKEVNVLIGVELGHLMTSRGLRTLYSVDQ